MPEQPCPPVQDPRDGATHPDPSGPGVAIDPGSTTEADLRDGSSATTAPVVRLSSAAPGAPSVEPGGPSVEPRTPSPDPGGPSLGPGTPPSDLVETPPRRQPPGPGAPQVKAPNLKDVASRAGVSHMTVSRVLNDATSVARATRERVLTAIRELDYRPNTAARALVTGRSRALGVVIFDTTLFGPASTLYGIEQAARDAGYSVNIVSLRTLTRQTIADALDSLRGNAVDGVIVIAPHISAARALDEMPQSLPLVAVESGSGSPAFPTVAVDQRAGAAMATQHLMSLGHGTVWHIAGPRDWLEAQEREQGWAQALAALGAEAPEPRHGDWSPRSGYEITKELLADHLPTALFVANDQMALGALRALREAGVEVPRDVSVVGFDDIPEAAYFPPPLSTVRQEFSDLGRRTFDLLLARIAGDLMPLTRSVVEPILVVRESSAPPRAR